MLNKMSLDGIHEMPVNEGNVFTILDTVIFRRSNEIIRAFMHTEIAIFSQA
jgi:hypothetical protein